MPRTSYNIKLEFSISLDDERLEDVEELVKGRINEMLAVLERKDDVRIGLVHSYGVTEA